MGHAGRQEGAEDGQAALSLKMLLGICIHFFHLHPIGQELAMWPHLAAMEVVKFSFYSG